MFEKRVKKLEYHIAECERALYILRHCVKSLVRIRKRAEKGTIIDHDIEEYVKTQCYVALAEEDFKYHREKAEQYRKLLKI